MLKYAIPLGSFGVQVELPYFILLLFKSKIFIFILAKKL